MIIQELGSCNLHSLCSVTVSPGRLPGGGLPPGSDRIAPDLRDFPLVSSTTLALPIWFTGPFPFHAVSTLPGRHPYLSSASSHSPMTLLNCPRLLAGSSGFSPPHCFQASQALSLQYYTQICHPLPLSQSGSLPSRVRFMTSPRNFGVRTGGFPRVRSHRLPISRPTSPRFGPPDTRTRSHTPARPPPRSHLVGLLFATYMGSASCFLQTPHLWVCPCPVGVVLPSGNGGLLLLRRLRHAGRTSDTPRKAGGLMSGAASKAVDPLAKRRAKARLSYQV